MNRRHFMATIGGVVAGVVAAKLGSGQSRMIFVGCGKNASDRNPGTHSRPLRTIMGALDRCGNGYAITVMPGTYQEDNPVGMMLRSNSRITIRGGSRITPRLKGTQA